MCVVCQAVTAGAALLAGMLPVADAVEQKSTTATVEIAVKIACSKIGQVKTSQGKTEKCVIANGKKVWQVVQTKTTTKTTTTKTTTKNTTTTTEPYRDPTVSSSSQELCRLQDQSYQRRRWGHLIAGFPLIETNFQASGTFKIALVPIDFGDLPGESNWRVRVDDQMKLLADFYDMVSEGRVSMQWQVHDSWVRASGSSDSFTLDRSRSDNNVLANAAFSAADPLVNFKDVRAVYFVLPAKQKFLPESVQGFFHSGFSYLTDEGRIYNYGVAGNFFDREYKNYWTFWAHEMGHMFPLPDLYDVGSQWWIGKILAIPGGPFSGFDMMANQDGPTRTLSAWLRFVMGWLSDSQVFCKPFSQLGDTQVTLLPIDERTTGLKTVMIPVSDSKLVVIESRRANTKFDCQGAGTSTAGWRARNGVIVYTADLTLGHGEGFMSLVAPEGRGLQQLSTCSAPSQLDAILQTGDSVITNGVKIQVLKSDKYDTIQITKP